MKCAKCGNTLATVICSKCGYSSKTDIWYLTQLSALELTIDINIQKTGYYYQKDKDNPVYVAPYSADFQVEEDRLVKYCGTSSYVRVPDGIRIIDKSAFAENKSIRTVTLPETVTEIREKAFYLCANLHSVVFPSKLEIIGDSAFAHSGFKTGTLPNSLKQLGAGVFSSTNMERVRVPSKVKVIPEYAFRNCNLLREVELCEGVEKIATGAFNFCERLRTIIIPNSLRQVELAFVGTFGISNVAASSEWKVKNVQIVKKMMPSFNEAESAAKANDKQSYKPYSDLNTNAVDRVQKKENNPVDEIPSKPTAKRNKAEITEERITSLVKKYRLGCYRYLTRGDAKFSKKIAKAISSYAGAAVSEQQLLMEDQTIFGSAREGFILTPKNIYFNNEHYKGWFPISGVESIFVSNSPKSNSTPGIADDRFYINFSVTLTSGTFVIPISHAFYINEANAMAAFWEELLGLN